MPPAIIDTHVHLLPSSLPLPPWVSSTTLTPPYDPSRFLASASNLAGYIYIEVAQSYENLHLENCLALSLPPPCVGVVLHIPYSTTFDAEAWWSSLPAERRLLKGVRFLTQDQPDGVALQEGFVHLVRWVLGKGLVWEVGVDCHRRGVGNFEEAIYALEAASIPGTVVVNHLAKPPLGAVVSEEWLRCVCRLHNLEEKGLKVYWKLSGGFNEVLDGDEEEAEKGLVRWAKPLVGVVGVGRVVWGSDWMVCGIGYKKGKGEGEVWEKWREVCERVIRKGLEERWIGKEEAEGVWGEHAKKAYGLDA